MRSHFNSFFLLTSVLATALATGCSTMKCDTCCETADTEWTILFDGQITDQLRGYNQDSFPTANWVVDNGALKTVPGKAVDLVTREKYTNFELVAEWKVTPAGNSGIMYRVAELDGPPWFTGPECQVLDDARHPDGKNPKTTAGALYGLIAPPATKVLKPVGEFNEMRIVFKDNHVEHWLNGVKLLDYTWGSPEIAELIKISKFKDMPRFMKETEGYISFQHHGEEAWFRKMKIRRL